MSYPQLPNLHGDKGQTSDALSIPSPSVLDTQDASKTLEKETRKNGVVGNGAATKVGVDTEMPDAEHLPMYNDEGSGATKSPTEGRGRRYTKGQRREVNRILKCPEWDHYGVLGIEHSADERTIAKAYRKTSFKTHPDKNEDKDATQAFKSE
jgi:hypothetical protein